MMPTETSGLSMARGGDADIVQTITVDPSLESALILTLVVVVRTSLSFSLEVELEGAFPWRLAALRRSTPAPAVPEQIGGTP